MWQASFYPSEVYVTAKKKNIKWSDKKGTTFSIYFPVTKKRDALRPYEQSELPTGTERILFVDDELPIAKMGGQILEGLGYQVTARTGSMEALELFKEKPNDFEMLLPQYLLRSPRL